MNSSVLRILCICCLAVFITVAAGCTKKGQDVPKLKERVTICQGGRATPVTLVAQENGFFDAEGVEAAIHKLGDGKTAMDNFLAGDCDFGIMGDSPVVKQAFSRDDFALIASLETSDSFTKILARKDRGIAGGADLKDKKIAVKKGTSSHTFADLYLKKNGIKPTALTFTNMDLKDMPDAIMSGKIDAFASSQMYIQEGKRLLGDNAVILSGPGVYRANTCLIAKKSFIAQKRDLVKRVMVALFKAETAIAAKPADTAKLLARIWNMPEAEAEAAMKEAKHSLSLGEEQMETLELCGRWMLETGLIENKPLPDFRKIIDTSFITEVKPNAAK